MLERYFRYILKKNGFGDVNDVLWSLGNSQGDGCSFVCTLDSDHLVKLSQHVYPSDVSKATDRVKNLMQRRLTNDIISSSDEALSMTLSQSGTYVHENTMDLGWDDFSYLGSNSEHEVQYEEYVKDILAFAKSLARDLERFGYGLLEATSQVEKVVWEFKTNQYLFRLVELGECVTDSASDWDEDLFVQMCNGMMDGSQKYCGLKAEIYDRNDADAIEEEIPLAEDCLWGINCATDDRFYGGYYKCLVSNVIDMIKTENKLAQAA